MLKLRWLNDSGLDGMRLMLDHFQQNLVMQVQEEYLLSNFETVEPKGIYFIQPESFTEVSQKTVYVNICPLQPEGCMF